MKTPVPKAAGDPRQYGESLSGPTWLFTITDRFDILEANKCLSTIGGEAVGGKAVGEALGEAFGEGKGP